MARPAIDPMFRSIGISYGSHAIGVLLSGRLNDGSAGLADLKRCGGLTVVQNPTDAAEAEMPLSALSASGVDYRAPAAELGPLLAKLLAEEPSPSVAPPPDIALEVEIALGQPVDTDMIARIGQPVALSCPACGGVMSQMKHGPPLRFRCQVGHAYTAEALSKDQEGAVDEAIRVALRIIEERAALTQKMAQDAHRNGRIRTAAQWDERVREYRTYAETLRQAAIKAEDQA
jgi:two-component system chemotaxis response regulator CheB